MLNAAAPAWGLSLAYWFHMLATVVWIGGLAAYSLVVVPAARRTLDAEGYGAFLLRVNGQMQRLGWFSLGVLGVTGLFQMSSNPSYEGFLAIQNTWSQAILAKHLVIVWMVGVSAYLTWFLHPAYQRLVLRQSKGLLEDEEDLLSLQRREVQLLWVNLGISLVVLALTALARVS